MRVLLTNPPRTFSDTTDLAPPLGLLKLATIAQNVGVEALILDLNLLYHLDSELAGSNFYSKATDLLLEKNADLYGFTSMGIDSHVAVELARRIKQKRPETICMLGGSHFSSIAQQILNQYPWIDLIICGEAEDSFREIVTSYARGDFLHRQILTSIPENKNNNTSVEANYALVNLSDYFSINPSRTMDFEGGRGCRFNCSFCYSPSHYQSVRTFDTEDKLKQLTTLQQLGAKHVFFVEDNFVNDSSKAIEFCRALESLRLNLSWTCYATIPQLNQELLTWMSRANCTSIFCGIDAVGNVSTRSLGKNFFRGFEYLERKTQEITGVGIIPTLAFLLSPPSAPCGSDSELTIRAALLVRSLGAHFRLNTLSLYSGTQLSTDDRYKVQPDCLKADLLFDVPPIVCENAYAKNNAALYPFHSRYVAEKEWVQFICSVHVLFTLIYCFPQTLSSLLKDGISPSTVAAKVLNTIGNVASIEKSERRQAELLAAVELIESLTSRQSISYSLDKELEALVSSREGVVRPDAFIQQA